MTSTSQKTDSIVKIAIVNESVYKLVLHKWHQQRTKLGTKVYPPAIWTGMAIDQTFKVCKLVVKEDATAHMDGLLNLAALCITAVESMVANSPSHLKDLEVLWSKALAQKSEILKG